jgi:hypothetical protein
MPVISVGVTRSSDCDAKPLACELRANGLQRRGPPKSLSPAVSVSVQQPIIGTLRFTPGFGITEDNRQAQFADLTTIQIGSHDNFSFIGHCGGCCSSPLSSVRAQISMEVDHANPFFLRSPPGERPKREKHS